MVYLQTSYYSVVLAVTNENSYDTVLLTKDTEVISQDAEPEKCNFNAPAIRKKCLSKFDKYNILAL